MRLSAPSGWPALSGNNSRTTGKKLEVDDLVRGRGCWIFNQMAFQGGGLERAQTPIWKPLPFTRGSLQSLLWS